MKVEKVYKNIRYTLSNEDLKVGDKVYPIGRGRCLDGGGWILHEIEFDSRHVKGLNTSGFPYEPHTIEDLKHSKDYKPYEVRTDMGFSPAECYYKIIKMEEQVKIEDRIFARWEWVEIPVEVPSEPVNETLDRL